MTKEAAVLLTKVTPCFGKNDPASAKTCGPLFAQCVAPNGTASCAASVVCFQQCPKDDGGCLFGCMKKATAPAAEKAMTAAMCGQSGDVSKCTNEIGACYGTGTGDCKSVLSCVAGSAQGDGGCLNACLETGNASAAGQTFVAAQCFNKTDTSCTAPIAQCLAPIGTKTCSALYTCLTPCNGKTGKELFACQYGCLAQGSTASTTDFFNSAKCDSNCTENCKKSDADPGQCKVACFKASCPKEQTSCTVPQ